MAEHQAEPTVEKAKGDVLIALRTRLHEGKMVVRIIFLKQSLIPKVETVCTCIATKMKWSMFWKVRSRSGSGIKIYRLARVVWHTCPKIFLMPFTIL